MEWSHNTLARIEAWPVDLRGRHINHYTTERGVGILTGAETERATLGVHREVAEYHGASSVNGESGRGEYSGRRRAAEGSREESSDGQAK